LAVKSSTSKDYVIAIECDGETYRSAKTTRDRDRLRQEILERMGWKYYRIWSTDWFRNKSLEQDKLLKAIKLAFVDKSISHKTKTPLSSFSRSVVTLPNEFPYYEMANERVLSSQISNIPMLVQSILKVESPLSEEWLLKRIVFKFYREKVTTVVRDEFNQMMYGCDSRYGIIRRNGFLYLKNAPIPRLRIPKPGSEPREIKYLSLEELANGLRELIKSNIMVEKAGLFRLLAEKLGFTRIGEAIEERLETALWLLGKEIEIHNGMIRLINN
jgi:hypothetical protein